MSWNNKEIETTCSTVQQWRVSVQSYSDTDTVFIVLLNSPVSVHIVHSAHSQTAGSASAVFMHFA